MLIIYLASCLLPPLKTKNGILGFWDTDFLFSLLQNLCSCILSQLNII
jgi:hypothetical protein